MIIWIKEIIVKETASAKHIRNVKLFSLNETFLN